MDTSCDRVMTSSTLPGVHFDLSGNHCRYTRAEVAAGIVLVYRTVVDAPLAGTVQQTLSPARCDPGDPSGLNVELNVGGGSQGFCWCDCGLGMGGTVHTSLVLGSYTNALRWDGTNWDGPSDTGNPHGAPFPTGTYQFTVHTSGIAPDGVTPFTIQGTLTFDLVP